MKSATVLGLLALSLASADCKKKVEAKHEQPAEAAPIDAASSKMQSALVVEPQTMVLRQVLVKVSDPAKAYALHSDRLAKRLGADLVASGWIAAREGQVPENHRARRVEAMLNLSYDVTLASAQAEGSIVVAIEVILEFIDDRSDLQPRVALIVQDALVGTTDDEVSIELNALAHAGLDTVAQSLVSRERLRRASHEELLSQLSLGGDEAGMKIWALQLAAERSLREAVPMGIQALSHEDEHVRAAAIAMLVSLKDPGSVAALSKDIDFKNYEDLRVLIEAVTAIGGEDAIEFLEFVASGHPDEDMRQRAKESTQELRRRAAPP